MRKVFLDIVGKKHSMYDELILSPPKDYEFIFDAGNWSDTKQSLHKAEALYEFQKRIVGRIMPVNLLASYVERWKKLPRDIDLTYSSGHLVFRKEPWIVDLEYVTHLSNYSYEFFRLFRSVIEKKLRSEECKKILPWTHAGEVTIRNTIKDPKIIDKVETVNLAVRKKEFTKIHNDEKVRFLFVGSSNIPRDFEIKGGQEVLMAFDRLSQSYGNIELVLRSYLPTTVKEKASSIRNVKVVANVIPRLELEELFKSADVFLFPSYNSPGMIILEAMSYELPVITTNVWANPEMVTDGVTGFLIEKSKRIRYVNEALVPTWSCPDSIRAIKKSPDLEVVSRLVDKCVTLIEDVGLRKTMGRQARQETTEGKFSIEHRNRKLKRILDALGN